MIDRYQLERQKEAFASTGVFRTKPVTFKSNKELENYLLEKMSTIFKSTFSNQHVFQKKDAKISLEEDITGKELVIAFSQGIYHTQSSAIASMEADVLLEKSYGGFIKYSAPLQQQA